MAIVYDQATCEQLWTRPDGQPGYVVTEDRNPGTGRLWWVDVFQQRIVPQNLATNSLGLIVGDGVGLLLERFIDAGYTSIFSIDNSTYMTTRRNNQGRADARSKFAERDIRTTTNVQMRSLTGRGGTVRFNFIITADVMSGYAPGEQAAMYDACDGFLAANGKVIHLMLMNWGKTPNLTAYGGCPARTLAEWQATRPTHTFLSLEGI